MKLTERLNEGNKSKELAKAIDKAMTEIDGH